MSDIGAEISADWQIIAMVWVNDFPVKAIMEHFSHNRNIFVKVVLHIGVTYCT